MWLLVALALAADPVPTPPAAPPAPASPAPSASGAAPSPSGAAPAAPGGTATPAPAAPAATAAAAAAPPLDPLRLRACPEQRCGERCIAWTELCPDAVRDTVTTMGEEARQARLAAAVCGHAPTGPAPMEPSVESQILLGAAASVLASSFGYAGCVDGTARPEDCGHDPHDRDLPAVPEAPPGPICGQSTGLVAN